MIELAKHIEVLLLENECVIIPELGGFITYYQPAHFEEMDNTYYPPFRTIGFNPQLDMNDGQLVQSYMHTHHTDYPDALRMIKDKVRTIKEKLYQDGIVEIPNIGILHYTIHDSYEFQPNPCGIVAPSLYGLDSFHITPLTCATINEYDQYPDTFYQTRKNTHKHFDMRWIGNAVAVAIAIVLFFILSVPVENTYIEKGHYASLGTDCLFEAIRSQSMATTLYTTKKNVPQKSKRNISPVEVRVEKVVASTDTETKHKVNEEIKKAETPVIKETVKETKKEAVKKDIKQLVKPVKPQTEAVQTKKRHHLIVASLATEPDAEKMLHKFQKEGYEEASVVAGNGRFRIAIYSYDKKETASKKLNELKQTKAFSDAWILTK